MKSNSVRQVRVEGGGGGLVAHVGLHALGAFADCLGVGASLSAAVPPAGERAPAHDRGKVLTQAMLMLAGGGEACTDIEYLRAEVGLFGAVASAPTLYRTLRSLDPATVEGLWAAQAAVREQIWARRASADAAAPVVLDIDATLVEIHSEHKAGAAAHYKGGYGFHPLLCFSDDGDALAAMLRPGNAAANNIEDHIAVLDAAIGRLPAEVAAGHRPGDDADLIAHPVVLRTDSAGCSVRIAEACRDRNVGFSLVARRNDAIDAAIAAVPATRARNARCSEATLGATGATGPTKPAPPPPATRTCAPTPSSRTTSPPSKPPASAACPSGTSTPTPPGSPSSAGRAPSSCGSNNSPAAPPLSPKPPPNGSAGRCGTPPGASPARGAVNRTGFCGGSVYWFPTSAWSGCWAL